MNTKIHAGVSVGAKEGWSPGRISRTLDAGVVECLEEGVSIEDLSDAKLEDARRKQVSGFFLEALLVKKLRNHNGYGLDGLGGMNVDEIVSSQGFLELWEDYQDLRQRIQMVNGLQWHLVMESLVAVARQEQLEKRVLSTILFGDVVDYASMGCRFWAFNEMGAVTLRAATQPLLAQTLQALEEFDDGLRGQGRGEWRGILNKPWIPRESVFEELKTEVELVRNRTQNLMDTGEWPETAAGLHTLTRTTPVFFMTRVAEGKHAHLPYKSCPGRDMSRTFIEWFWQTFERGERGGVVLRGE